MARNNKDFGGASDSARGAESGVDHAGIAIGIIGSGMSNDQKVKALSDHPTMPQDIKTKAIDQVVRAAGGGIAAAPGASTPENRPSVKGGEAKPISMEEALVEQAGSKRQAARSGAAVPQTSRPGRVKDPTNRTRGVDIRQKMPAKDVEHGLRALHVHLATISNSLQSHASTPEEISSISETNEHLSKALGSLSKGASIGEGRRIDGVDKRGIPTSKFINRQGEANEHYIEAMGHTVRVFAGDTGEKVASIRAACELDKIGTLIAETYTAVPLTLFAMRSAPVQMYLSPGFQLFPADVTLIPETQDVMVKSFEIVPSPMRHEALFRVAEPKAREYPLIFGCLSRYEKMSVDYLGTVGQILDATGGVFMAYGRGDLPDVHPKIIKCGI
jgi:hypothetical protein